MNQKEDMIIVTMALKLRKLNLYDYIDTDILVKGTISVPNTDAVGAAVKNTNKKVTFTICAPFTDWIGKTNHTK